jgi:predicted metallo-beta-lactamase superfamily hydrolase
MIIKILGTESLGVRGLSCSIELKNRKIFIDPGIALGWSRFGFLPHPFQIAIGVGIRDKIIEELKTASDVIFSHFDGDHCPLYNPNPYQLGIYDVKNSLSDCRIWAKGPNNSPPTQQKRRRELTEIVKRDLQNAEGEKDGPLEFSFPVPHGQQGGEENMVMMSRIEEEGETFVHASDTQLLEKKTIEIILDFKPDVVLVSGPPLYHFSSSSFNALREKSLQNAMELSKNVDTVIIDHHLLRSEEGIDWIIKLKHASRNKIYFAADFMKREAIFLEAWRKELYEWLPVYKNWHEDYKQGKVDVNNYRIRGWEALIANGKIKPCKWYYSCPVKEYTDAGKLERYWIEEYCLVNNKNCLRYQMVEKGEYHPDNMLPNGEIRENL